MALWALALSIVERDHPTMDFGSLGRIGGTHPWAGAALVLAALSTGGFPLLAGFPPRMDVWVGLADVSGKAAIWYLVGLAGLIRRAARRSAVTSERCWRRSGRGMRQARSTGGQARRGIKSGGV